MNLVSKARQKSLVGLNWFCLDAVQLCRLFFLNTQLRTTRALYCLMGLHDNQPVMASNLNAHCFANTLSS